MDHFRLIGAGIYPIPEASRLTAVPVRSIRRWIKGYSYTRDGQTHKLPPVVAPQIDPIDGVFALSFRDLQEIRFLHAFRELGVSWHVLRLASRYAKDIVGSDHPFSTGRFRSFGNSIMTAIAIKTCEQLLIDIVKNQLAFKRLIAPFLRGLEFDHNEPVRWFPTASRRIVVDPHRSFGQPVLQKEGVPTLILAKAYSTERSINNVAQWYDVDPRSVKAAVDFERRLAA